MGRINWFRVIAIAVIGTAIATVLLISGYANHRKKQP